MQGITATRRGQLWTVASGPIFETSFARCYGTKRAKQLRELSDCSRLLQDGSMAVFPAWVLRQNSARNRGHSGGFKTALWQFVGRALVDEVFVAA